MKKYVVIVIAASILAALWIGSVAAQEKKPLPVLDENLKKELNDYLDQNYMTPEEYVISKFKDHDIIILGEQHRARHDVILIQNFIPHLYKAGIYALGTEFASRVDQPLIDSLLGAPEYDDKLAQKITLNQFVGWGYREYVDIFRAAWKVNQSRPAGAREFRILALNNDYHWWHIQTQEDRSNRELRKKVFHGQTEEDWANVLLQEVVAKGEKALAYCGIHHAFTEYRQPYIDPEDSTLKFNEDRFGRHLFNEMGKKVITIFLHNYWSNRDWSEYVYAVGGYIDALMLERDSTKWRIGFDVKGTPFEKLADDESYYSMGYDDFNLGMFCDGYIYQIPLSRFDIVTCIEGFINEDNIDFARRNAVNPWYRDKSVEQFEQSCEREIKEVRSRYEPFY